MKITEYLIVGILCMCIFSIAGAAMEQWPMVMGNQYLTGNNDEITPEFNSLNWSYAAEGAVYYPVACNGLVYFVSIDHSLYAVDEVTGIVRWKNNCGSAMIDSPVVYKNNIIVNAARWLFCFNALTGETNWAFANNIENTYGTPIVINNRIYYGSRNHFYCRDIQNGCIIWQNDEVRTYGGSPIYWDEYIYTPWKDFHSSSLKLACLNANTGKLVWQKSLENDINIYTPVVYNLHVYCTSLNNLYCCDAETGKMLWHKQFQSLVASPTVFNNGKLYISLTDKRLAVIDPGTGAIIDYIPNHTESGAAFAIVGETVFVPDRNGQLHSIDIRSKKLNWTFSSPHYHEGGGVPSIAHGRVYFPVKNRLYSLSPGIVPPGLIASAGHGNTRSGPAERIPDNTAAAAENVVLADAIHNEAVQPDTALELNANSPQRATDPLPVYKGTLTDTITKKPINGYITAFRLEPDGRATEVRTLVKDGTFTFQFPGQDPFEVLAEADGYLFKSDKVNPENPPESLDFNLQPFTEGAMITLNNIEFDFGKSSLRPSSYNELNRIVRFMNENSTIQLEVRGHTDNVGDHSVNQKLSEERAQRVVTYLIKNGINSRRLQWKGFGEDMPITDNTTPNARQKNRRTEFKIIKK